MAIKDIKINGKTITEMTIDGNVFKGGSDGGTVASISAVEKHIKDNLVWTNNAGVIDTTDKLDNLDVTYSKSTGLVDGEKIDATVHYIGGDSSVLSSTVDVDYKGIEMVNYSKTITDKEVSDFVDANVVFTGDVGVLDLTKWSVTGTTLYTAHPNNITKGDDFIYIVRADAGFTVNGSTQFDVTYNIPDKVGIVYLGGNKGLNILNDDDTLTKAYSISLFGGDLCQTSDGTIYIVNEDGLHKIENNSLTTINSTKYSWSFIDQLSNGTIYIGYSSGLYTFNGSTLTKIAGGDYSYGFIYELKNGTIYVGTHDNGLKKLVGNSIVDVISTRVNAGFMLEAQDGEVYLGISSGLKKISNDIVSDYISGDIHNGFILEKSDGTIYVGAGELGLKKIVNDAFEDISSDRMYGSRAIITSKGRILIGGSGENGLKELINDSLSDVNSADTYDGIIKEVFV